MKTVITVDAMDIVALIAFGFIISALIFGKIMAFLYGKICDFMKKRRERKLEKTRNSKKVQ